MRRKTCVLLFVTLLIGLATLSSGVDASPELPLIYVDPPTYTAISIGEFTINISVADVYDLQYVEFKLSYNTTILDATDVAEGPFLKSFGNTSMWMEIHDDLGYMLLSILIRTGGPAEGNGTLATITFNATYQGHASCVLDLYETTLGDPYGQQMIHEVTDGYYEFTVLALTVTTDKKFYVPRGLVKISGNLTKDDLPVDGLVALEVDDPDNAPIVIRTLQLGSNPPAGNITITEFFPCYSNGTTPKYNFRKETLANFKVTVKNNGSLSQYVLITINAYDQSKTPIGIIMMPWLIYNNTSTGIVLSIPIPDWAATGNATVYACILSNVPRFGFAYCPEAAAAFNITTIPGQGVPPSVETQINLTGSYNLTFELPPRVGYGEYGVYVSSNYQQLIARSNAKFGIKIPGDANGDGHVTIGDLAILGRTWGLREGDPGYDSRADFNGDGKVSIGDLAILGANWYRY